MEVSAPPRGVVPPLRKMPSYSDGWTDRNKRTGPFKFTAYLPGGPKYTGAQYESLGMPEAAGPRGGRRPSKPAMTSHDQPAPTTSPAQLQARIVELERMVQERVAELEGIVEAQMGTIQIQQEAIRSLQRRSA